MSEIVADAILREASIAAVGFSRGCDDILQPGMLIPGMTARSNESREATAFQVNVQRINFV